MPCDDPIPAHATGIVHALVGHSVGSVPDPPPISQRESPAMMSGPNGSFDADSRLLDTLQRLLRIQSPEIRPALTEASTSINEVLGAEKVDVFLYESRTDSLVAMGTSETPMGRRQHELGLDRQPLANGGTAVLAYRTGEPYLSGHADQDGEQLRGNVEGLGVRSTLDVPLVVEGRRRGVLSAMSTLPERFAERDLEFVQAVAGWIALLLHRAELVEQHGRDAVRTGRRQAGEEVARLTRRQQQVAACVAEGLTNEEIAQRLVLAPGTVANHIEGILRRLDLRSRAQIATWAVERGLYSSEWDEEPDDAR
jgi:DNA-binding CsgD family transcriptional regulator